MFWLGQIASAQTIPDQIDALLANPALAGTSWSILVENAEGSVVQYQRNPLTGLAPASNTKMFTTAAAFGLLGSNHVFETRLYLQGSLTGGVLNGNLNLVCEHDPTWNTSVFPGNARAPLDYIAARLKAMGLTAVNGSVQSYGCCFYNLTATDPYNHNASYQPGYNADAAMAFVAALQAQGISVSGAAIGQTGFSAAGTLFYTYYSTNLTYGGKPLRLDVACIPLLKVSHNVMADALLRHIGWKLSGVDSYAAGATRVLSWLNNTAGVSTTGMVMNDGSGLSHGNRFSARQTVALTRYMLPAFPSWSTGLPIGCADGTLGGRFCNTGGSGKVHAKTGSLSISIALSGYLDNPHDNERYFFSFIANKTNIDQTATRNAIDAAVVLFAQRGVPLSPELLRVTSHPNGTSLQLAWSDEKFVRTAYRVYSSSNGINFDATRNIPANVHTYLETGLTPGAKRYYKVSVVGASGESKASRIYGAQAGGNARVLIVDGNDRWRFQPNENPHATNHAFAALAGQSISGPTFETAHHNAVLSGNVVLTDYPAVIWLLGEESTEDETFSATEQALVTDYLAAGGNLFVSGAEVGWDLDRASGPTAADRNFYHNVLRAVYHLDDANTYAFTPTGGGIFVNNPASGFDNGTYGMFNVDYPDVLLPTNGSSVALNYVGGTGGAAAVQYDGSLGGGRVMNWGFPFESITNSFVRERYLSDVLRFFTVLDPPQLATPEINSQDQTLTLRWSASSGLRYRVQFTSDLNAPVWRDLPGDVIATNTSAIKLDPFSSGATPRFYRVRLVD